VNRDWRGYLITLLTVALVLRKPWNPLWLLAAGALAGVLGLVEEGCCFTISTSLIANTIRHWRCSKHAIARRRYCTLAPLVLTRCLILETKADFDGYLKFLDFVSLDKSAHLGHFEPVYMAQGLTRFRDRVLSGFGKAAPGDADDFNFLVCPFHVLALHRFSS
jgi:hypothetical protein